MTKRAICKFTAAAVLCLCWGARTAAADAPAAAKRFQHKRFSIAFPEDWTTRSKDKGNTVVAQSPEGPYLTLHYWTARGRRGLGIACSAEAAQFEAAKGRMQAVALTFKAK